MGMDLPDDLKQLFLPLQCNLCHCTLTSTTTSVNHYKGKKHISNIKKWLLQHPEHHGPTVEARDGIFSLTNIYCKYCNVIMSSEQQAQSHYSGRKHQNVIKNGIKREEHNCELEQFQKCVVKGESRDSSEGGRSILRKSQKSEDDFRRGKFYVDISLVPRPSQLTFGNRSDGAKCMKATKSINDDVIAVRDNILEDVLKNEKNAKSPSDLSIYRTPSNKYYCRFCNGSFNSAVQFMQHKESKKHKRKFVQSLVKEKKRSSE